MALLLSVWDACRRQLSVTDKNRAESKLGVQDRVVQTSEYAAMRRALEDYRGPWHLVRQGVAQQVFVGSEARAG